MSEQTMPPQEQQRQPGREQAMHPQPEWQPRYASSQRLAGKVALITGGDSGIGRAIAALFAREGADVAIAFLEETADARKTVDIVEAEGRRAFLLEGDVGDLAFCERAVAHVMEQTGRLDILVNNAAEQHPANRIEDIDLMQFERTMRTNAYGYFFMARCAVPRMQAGSTIVNTTSITAYRGSAHLIDYAATKGWIVGFTRSLAQQLVERGIRVNAVAPGPIWTPLIPASFEAEKVQTFGADVPLKRPGQPNEVAPAYLFLACEDSSYMTGQVLHPNGGTVING